MLIGALSSAGAGLTSAVALLDRGAGRVARATAVSTPPAEVPAAREPADDDLVSGMTDLLLARTVLGANAFTVRRADEAYRSVLGLLDR